MRNDSISNLILYASLRARHRGTVFVTVFVVVSALLLILAGCGPASSAPSAPDPAPDPSVVGEVTVRDASASEAQPDPYAQVTVDNLPSVESADTAAPDLAFAGEGASGSLQATEASDYPCISSTATVAQIDDRQVTLLDGTRLILDELERVIGEIEISSVLFITVCTDDLGVEHTTIFVLQSPDAPSSPDNPSTDNRSSGDSSLDRRITICHLPPGNSARRHTIHISESALEAHLAHGDYPGECWDDDDDRDDDHKVTLCHAPPVPAGRPSQANTPRAQTIRVDASSVNAHLAHGDTLGACAGDDDDENRNRGQDDDEDDDDDDRGDKDRGKQDEKSKKEKDKDD